MTHIEEKDAAVIMCNDLLGHLEESSRKMALLYSESGNVSFLSLADLLNEYAARLHGSAKHTLEGATEYLRGEKI